MADIQITPLSVNNTAYSQRNQVWLSSSICYQFYAKNDTYSAESLNCRKSVDGGQTWGTDIKISSLAAVANACQIFAIWFDQWTPGNSGTKIHCYWLGTIQGSGGSSEYYRSIDTNDDSLGTEKLLFQWGVGAWVNGKPDLTITKARGGNLYLWMSANNNSQRMFWRSTDNGATWSSVASLSTHPGTEYTMPNIFSFLVPANLADQNDIYLVGFKGTTGGEIVVWEYDNSADTWTKTTVGTHDAWDGDRNLAAAVRESDGHILVPFITAGSGFPGTQDCVFYDITNAGTITQKTSVFIGAASFTRRYVDIVIDQLTDDIYVAYFNDTTDKIEVQKSTDGGTTWGTASFFNDTNAPADSVMVFWLGQSTADSGGRVYATWMKPSTNELWGNYAHSIALVRARRVFVVA